MVLLGKHINRPGRLCGPGPHPVARRGSGQSCSDHVAAIRTELSKNWDAPPWGPAWTVLTGGVSQTGTAERWAQTQTTGAVRWKSLEIAAFSSHRTILRALGATRADKRSAKRGPTFRWWYVLLIPVMLAAALVGFYPAGAFLLLADGRNGRFDISGIEASVALPLAGALLLVGGVVHLVVVLRRRRRHPTQSGFDGVAVVFGAIDALSIARRGSDDDVRAWQLWLVVALLVVLVGVTGLVRGRRLAEPVDTQDGEPRAAVRRLVAKLSDAERDAVRRDLEAAVDDLARRGLVTPETAVRAKEAELGMLSIAVS